MLADNPKVTLVAVVHALALGCLYHSSLTSCIKVRGSMTYLGGRAEGIDDGTAYRAIRRHHQGGYQRHAEAAGKALGMAGRQGSEDLAFDRCRLRPLAPSTPWRSGAA